MTLPPDEYPDDYTLGPADRRHRAYEAKRRRELYTVIAVLLALLWTTGAVGGTWYLAHRIDQDSQQGGVDD